MRALFSNKEVEAKVYPHQIAFNCLPQIDVFLENGYTKEEMKMVNETKKILEDDIHRVTATTVRVPVLLRPLRVGQRRVRKRNHAGRGDGSSKKAPGVKVIDDPSKKTVSSGHLRRR